MRIVPLAVKNYFVYGIPVKDTILKHQDIFDFCLQLKCNSNSTGYIKHFENGQLVDTELGRMTRYYIAKGLNAGMLYKKFTEGDRISGVNIGYSAIIFNKYEKKDISDYNLDYDFYIAEANKLIKVITAPQMQLELF